MRHRALVSRIGETFRRGRCLVRLEVLLTYVDSAILDVTERLCRKFQVLTGRTNVWLALQLTNLSVVVYFVWAILVFWSTDVVLRIGVAIFCGALL